MTEFPALEVFVHRHRDAKVFTDGIKKLGFKSNQFTVSVCIGRALASRAGAYFHVVLAVLLTCAATGRKKLHQDPSRPGTLTGKFNSVGWEESIAACAITALTTAPGLTQEQRKYVRKYVDEVYAASDSSEWT